MAKLTENDYHQTYAPVMVAIKNYVVKITPTDYGIAVDVMGSKDGKDLVTLSSTQGFDSYFKGE